MTSQTPGSDQQNRDPEGQSSADTDKKPGKTEPDPTSAPIGSGWSAGEKPGQLPTGETS